MTIRTAYLNGNLHIELCGNFTASGAARLAEVIGNASPAKSNVYVNTHDVHDVSPEGVTLFAKLAKGLKTAHQLILVGEKGFAIAPEGCQVIVDEQDKGGCRNCTNCRCGKRRQQ
ncbi:MAG: hypothetical protein AB1413_02030 [Thermodesulfobacteriota bacterium]